MPQHGCNIRNGNVVSYVFDLVYAFYKSPLTPQKYKPIFDRILLEYLT